MDNANRKYIDFERSKSERSHPSPAKTSNFYKNQKVVPPPAKDVKYPKFDPDL